MRIIGLVSTKGGTGKTTIIVNLAAVLAAWGERVVVIDSDPAGHAAEIGRLGSLNASITALALDTPDASAVREWAQTVRRSTADYVIIDAEGARGPSFAATIAVSDLVIVPAGTSLFDLRGTVETVGIVRRHRDGAGRGRPKILIVPSRIDRRTSAGREISMALERIGEPVAGAITARSVVVDSLATGGPVPATSISNAEFRGLAETVQAQLGEVA